jgi:hypothetical protein
MLPNAHTKSKKEKGPKPNMSAKQFFFQHCLQQHKKKNPTECCDRFFKREFAVNCAVSWDNMEEKKKARFVAAAELDKKRFAIEMQIVEKNKNKSRKKELPKGHKRPMSAFFHYKQDELKKLEKDVPMASNIQKISVKWRKEMDEVKDFYNKKAKEDKMRYAKAKLDTKPKAKTN